MWHRILAVLRAGLAAQWGRGSWPAAPIVMHGSISALLCGLASGALAPFAYGILALSISGLLLAIPLLGEFGTALRRDASAEWIEAQPITRFELRAARMLMLAPLVAALVLAALIPAACFAPDTVSLPARVWLVGAGLAQACVLTAVLMAFQSALGERAEALLVAVQTLLVAGVVIGLLVGLRGVAYLQHVKAPTDAPAWLAALPSAWFAAYLAPSESLSTFWRLAPWVGGCVSLVILAAMPLPPASKARRSGGWLAFVLAPARWLATRVWVRPSERASFDLVFDALPLEREFALRTYPMFGIPLAMLVMGARGASPAVHDASLALMLFTPATYLPILLVQVPATTSPAARWILDTAPVSRERIANGALKAVAVRFLVPLYAMLALLTWVQGDWGMALCWTPPAFFLSLAILRKLFPLCVTDLPLSVNPDEIFANMDWTGTLLTLALLLTFVAVLAFKLVTSLPIALGVSIVLLAIEWSADRRAEHD